VPPPFTLITLYHMVVSFETIAHKQRHSCRWEKKDGLVERLSQLSLGLLTCVSDVYLWRLSMPVAGVIQVDSFTRETGVCVSVVDDVLLQSVVLTGRHGIHRV